MSKLSTLAICFFLLAAITTETSAQRTATKRSSTKLRTVAPHCLSIRVDEAADSTNFAKVDSKVEKDILSDVLIKNESSKTPKPEFAQTKAINIADKCDAYPWISSDGLRLYFNSNRDGGHGNIYFSRRSSVDQPFEAPHKAFPSLENKYYAVSLTADELTMILTLEGYTLYIATRKSVTENFSTPKVIEELKDRRLFAPGISADGSELMVIDCTGDNDTKTIKSDGTIRYVKNAAGIFTRKERLIVPDNKVVGPGQLGKDGLTYYCSLKNPADQTEKLYCFKRADKNSAFKLANELPAEINVTKASLQPCLNGDGTVLAYCINNSGMWDDDDIRVVQLDKLSAEEKGTELKPLVVEKQLPLQGQGIKLVLQTLVLNSSSFTSTIQAPAMAAMPLMLTAKNINDKLVAVSVYPNPFNNYLVITFAKQPASQNLWIELFDGNGRLAFTKKISGSSTQIKTGNLPSGMYTYRISSTEGIIAKGQLIGTK
ncbi:T9SS type A sorting domain-containing protein [Ferruginibacter sp. SUN106]|uniref:T9SS type A sorting domain-containing protein n=1 Tax=Ferruginibacter sp. SUN106 TaxID=2978348 RepID=UPI003D35EE91